MKSERKVTANELEKNKITHTEITMYERELKNSRLIAKFVADDLRALSKKLELVYNQREEMHVQVEAIEKQVKDYGLDNQAIHQIFDKLTSTANNLRHEIDTMEIDSKNRATALEKKVNDLARITENKKRLIQTLAEEERHVQAHIIGIKKRESERELLLINQIATKEKKKIAMMTGDTRILSEDTLPLKDSTFRNSQTDLHQPAKLTITPKSLQVVTTT
jgi:uncharacterized protein (UPF0335 family)